jgi:hypothetical protein
MVAFRPQDQADIETLLIANRDEIDVDYIRREWSPVAEGEEARTRWLENHYPSRSPTFTNDDV